MLISRQIRQNILLDNLVGISIDPTKVLVDSKISMRTRTDKSLDPYRNPEKRNSKTPSHGS